MLQVHEAEKIILENKLHLGVETINFRAATGRILAENLVADRDFPPFNRVTMDGIAIRFADFAAGCRTFFISKKQAAGDVPIENLPQNNAIEIMTGAAMPICADCVIPYEMLEISANFAKTTTEKVIFEQNIHKKGRDRKMGNVLLAAGKRLGAPEISVAAAVGKSTILVKKMPRVVVFSTGDELVEVDEIPTDFQIRRSNNFAIEAVLKKHGLAPEMRHLPDDLAVIEREIEAATRDFDVILISGGVSAGKFDFIPNALENCGVWPLFYKVRQRPGKPFWFGRSEKTVVFAFPGNPISTFMCLHRFFLPWLASTVGFPETPATFAALAENFHFEPDLQYFLQVKLLFSENAQLLAHPIAGNGSGDFANLLEADAFLELPSVERSDFRAGEIFRVWRF
jgi:molybdopterin molybdotransferase